MALKFDNQRDSISSISGFITIDNTGALRLPVGSQLQRPSPETGSIRFNSDISGFEGYDGISWSSLGGSVIDVDGNTYIIAETSPNADNNQLDFFTDGAHRLRIDSDGDIKFGDNLDKFIIDWSTGDTEIAGDLTVAGDFTISGTTTYIDTVTLNIGDNIITLNADETGAPTQDAGIEVERGTSTNVSFVWDETNDRWTTGTENFEAGSVFVTGYGQVISSSGEWVGDPDTVRGYTGSIGFTGSQGIQGFTGSQGLRGFTGSRGFAGSQGPVGVVVYDAGIPYTDFSFGVNINCGGVY